LDAAAASELHSLFVGVSSSKLMRGAGPFDALLLVPEKNADFESRLTFIHCTCDRFRIYHCFLKMPTHFVACELHKE
jgi:hypothetical protein